MPTVTTPALVLHVMPYGETSAIVRLLTRDLGLTSGMARGARRPKSRTGPRLDLFTAGIATLLVKPHHDLHPLTAFEASATHANLAADVARFAAASALAELALKCAPADAHPEVFDAAMAGMRELGAAEAADVDAVALCACWAMVDALGFAPALDQCVVCGEPSEGGLTFSTAQGGALCSVHRRGVRTSNLAPDDADALAALIAGRIPEPALDERHAAAHRRLLIDFVRQHLAEDRPLPALAFWDGGAWTRSSAR